jgi:hypothetical protein
VFLLVIEDDHIAFALTEVVSRDYISDYMNCDFEVVGKAMKMLFVIIKASDSVLHRFLTDAKVEPFFATSWLLTWFSHDLPLIADAARVYDAILCSHPLYCYYICAAVRQYVSLSFCVVKHMFTYTTSAIFAHLFRAVCDTPPS